MYGETFRAATRHNHKSSNMKFTYQFSTEKATFVDADISKNNDGSLDTSIHVKKTNNHQYIEYSSCHPLSYHSARLSVIDVSLLTMKILRKSLINSRVIS